MTLTTNKLTLLELKRIMREKKALLEKAAMDNESYEVVNALFGELVEARDEFNRRIIAKEIRKKKSEE